MFLYIIFVLLDSVKIRCMKCSDKERERERERACVCVERWGGKESERIRYMKAAN
jgi:hypothetical protein